MTRKKTLKTRSQFLAHEQFNHPIPQSEKNNSIITMRRKIIKLQRSLAERENEVWTLKQLLLYR